MLKQRTKVLIYLLSFILCASVVSSQDAEEAASADDVFIFDIEDIVIEEAPIIEDPVIRSGQVTVFDKSSIEACGAKTVADVVERAPGVIVSRTGSILEPQTVSIRGGASDHVLVLIDGKPAESLWSGSSDIGRISVQNIERIEVIRGAAAAVYGEGAFSGVINIITEKNSEAEAGAEFEYGYASFDTHQAGAVLYGPIAADADIDGRISAGGLYTGGGYSFDAGGGYSFDAGGSEQQRTNNDGWSVNLSGGGGWSGESSEFSLSADFKASERGTPGIMEFLTPSARSEEIVSSAGIIFGTDMGEKGSLSLDAGYSQNYSRYTNPDDNINDSNSGFGLGAAAGWECGWDISEIILELMLSGGYSWDSLESTALTDSTGSAVDGAAEQSSADLRAVFTLELGPVDLIPAAGFDWSLSSYAGLEPVTDSALSWSAALGWSVFRDETEEGPLYLKANIGSTYKNPSFQDLFWPSGALASGNPDLKAEHGLSLDAGVYLNFPEPDLKFEAVGFIGSAEDLIQWMPSAGGIWRPRNIGSVLTSGAEFSAACSMGELFDFLDADLTFSYSWLKTVDWDESSVNYGRQLAYRPEHSARAGIRFRVPDVLSLDLDASYLGLRYTNNSNTKYLESVLVFSAAVNYDINEVFRITMTAENFTDQQYIDRLGYPIPGFEWSVTGRANL